MPYKNTVIPGIALDCRNSYTEDYCKTIKKKRTHIEDLKNVNQIHRPSPVTSNIPFMGKTAFMRDYPSYKLKHNKDYKKKRPDFEGGFTFPG